MKKKKIFVLGLTHTGKNSLDAALSKMKYTYRHYPTPDKVIELSKRYDVLSDTPVIPYMERLDTMYPDARFILTVRDIEDWLASCKRHWSLKKIKMTKTKLENRKRIYGITHFDADIFRKVYIAHEHRVRDYFKGRAGKLLVLDICGGEGYKELCNFLGRPVIDEKFPHKKRDKISKRRK